MKLAKVRVVGHGVDELKFTPGESSTTDAIVAIGRLDPVKSYHLMIRAIAACRKRFGVGYPLHIYGPINNAPYKQRLERLCKQCEVDDLVEFRGTVSHRELPDIIRRYQMMLFCCESALGKAAVEGMSCGLPVLTTNECVADILPADLRAALYVPAEDPAKLGEQIQNLMSLEEHKRTELGMRLREVVVKNHNVHTLWSKILLEIDRDAQVAHA